MDFQGIKHHIEDNGCVLDHYEDDLYYGTNVINGHTCQILQEDSYTELMVFHICYELRIPVPMNYSNADYNRYKTFRQKTIGKGV